MTVARYLASERRLDTNAVPEQSFEVAAHQDGVPLCSIAAANLRPIDRPEAGELITRERVALGHRARVGRRDRSRSTPPSRATTSTHTTQRVNAGAFACLPDDHASVRDREGAADRAFGQFKLYGD